MDLRSQTSLAASFLCLALSASVLLRTRRKRLHWLCAAFTFTISLWYFTTFAMLYSRGEESPHGPFSSLLATTIWEQFNLCCAVVVPFAASRFFRAFSTQEQERIREYTQPTFWAWLALIAGALSPLHTHVLFGTAVFVYVLISIGSALVILYRARTRARSRIERARLLYLVVVGACATLFTLVDYLPYVRVDIPPVGTVLILVFVYVLTESVQLDRLFDLYEVAGRIIVLTALSFSITAILWLLATADPGNFFLPSVVASLVLLLVFDPVRAKVEQSIAQLLLRERRDFEVMANELKRQLANVLNTEDLVRIVVSAFEGSRRITHGALYLADENERHFNLVGCVGSEPPKQMDAALVSTLLHRLERDQLVVLESLERELVEARENRDRSASGRLADLISNMEAMNASVCAVMRGEGEVYGLFCIRDDRLRDAFSPEELQLFAELAAQASVAIENSKLYQRLHARDRLAALGEMAAGLAHEIRNPLGAIKASAQFLTEASSSDREFLDIIVEEVDRLNRVVSSFLDYARPSQTIGSCDVNATLQKTLQLLSSEMGNVQVELQLAGESPRAQIDAERLRQVLINLVRNAVQAMNGEGRLTLSTQFKSSREGQVVECAVTDTGPGLAPRVQQHLFVPFVTTKTDGTGLGLAISQRIVSAASGTLWARSTPGKGTTFVVRLPIGV